MKLQELLEIQKELNSYLEITPTNEQLCWAIMAELGEFANSRKGDWCWWKRQGKEFSSEARERQLDELADILCFLLTGLLNNGIRIVESDDDGVWSKQFDSLFSHDAKAAFAYLVTYCNDGLYDSAIIPFVRVCANLGFTQSEIEAAYLKKVEVNKQRWEAGEKDGSITPPQLPYKDYPVTIQVDLPGGGGSPMALSTIAPITKYFTQEQWNSFPVLNQYQAIKDVAYSLVKVLNVSLKAMDN